MLDRSKSLDEGAILLPGYPVGSPGWQFYANDDGSLTAEHLRRHRAARPLEVKACR